MENAQLSDEREQLARQLVQSQKLETAGRLAAGVAHDFNNLLTVIMGYAYSGLAHLPPQSPAEPDLEEIEKAASRAEELTQNLLAFSMRGEMDHQAVDVNQLITGQEFVLSRLMGEDIDLVLLLEPNLNHVMAGQSQLEQVLVNLALNARDAMPTGERYRLELQRPWLALGHYSRRTSNDLDDRHRRRDEPGGQRPCFRAIFHH